MDLMRIIYGVGVGGLCASLIKGNELGMALSFLAICFGSVHQYIVIERQNEETDEEEDSDI